MNLQQAYLEELKSELLKDGIKHIKVVITDINGVLRCKYLSVEKFVSSFDKGFNAPVIPLNEDNIIIHNKFSLLLFVFKCTDRRVI